MECWPTTDASLRAPPSPPLPLPLQFVLKGFDALDYKEHADFTVVESANPELKKTVVRINVFHSHRQVGQTIRKRSARKVAGATGGRLRSRPMTGSSARTIRSFSPFSIAPSRPVRFAVCYAIRSLSCGSMRSDGANRKAAPSRWCSTRSESAISSTWFSTAPCATSRSGVGSHLPTRT